MPSLYCRCIFWRADARCSGWVMNPPFWIGKIEESPEQRNYNPSLPSPSTRSRPHAILPIVTQSKFKIKTIACLTPRKGAFLIIGGGGGGSANEVFAKLSDIN